MEEANERMSGQPVFEKLARSLSEKERRELLARIRHNLDIDTEQESRVAPYDAGDEERSAFIQRDIRRLSPLAHFLITVRRIVSGKSMQELVPEYRLKKMKKRLKHKVPGFINFDTRTLKPLFAEELFQLFLTILPQRPIFRALWRENGQATGLQEVIYRLVEDTLDIGGVTPTDLLSLDEMVELYGEDGNKSEMYAELDKRTEKLVNSVSRKEMSNAEELARPFFALRDVVLYPFEQLFEQFNAAVRVNDPTTKPHFTKASAHAVLGYLEELYYALYSASKVKIPGELLKGAEHERLAELIVGIIGDEEQREYVYRELHNLGQFASSITAFQRKLPLPDLIRVLKRDPYYKLVAYVPHENIYSFYTEMKKAEMRVELEEMLVQVLQRVFERDRKKLFAGYKLRDLRHYRKYSFLNYDELGVPAFRYHQSLVLVFNFLTVFYNKEIQKTIQVAESSLLSQDRELRDKMVQAAAACEDTVDKIRQLDQSLSPDDDDGKIFQRIRFQKGLDERQTKMLRSLVSRKDGEAKEILSRSREAIMTLEKTFDHMAKSSDEKSKERLQHRIVLEGRPWRLKDAIETQRERMHSLQRLLGIAERLRDEKGSDEVLPEDDQQS
jgi:hypothetical protein